MQSPFAAHTADDWPDPRLTWLGALSLILAWEEEEDQEIEWQRDHPHRESKR
jgi:hypothetical protein